MVLFVGAREVASSDLFFDGVERLDLRQGIGDAGGIRGFGLKEAATRMRPTLRMRQPGLLNLPLIRRIAVADANARVMHTPGHTPACVSFVIGDTVFVCDTLFMPAALTR